MDEKTLETESKELIEKKTLNEEGSKISSILNDIVKNKGYDYLYANPMEAYALLPKKKESEAKISNAVMYALLSGVGNKSRNKLSVIRMEIEALSLDEEMTETLDGIFSSLWEENYLLGSKEREYGGYEEFCFRLWDVEFRGGALWTGKDEKRKLVLSYKYSVKFKVENSSIVFKEMGDNHYLSADDIAVKYKKGMEEIIQKDFKDWCESSVNKPQAEVYDLARGTIVLDFYLEDHGLIPLTVSYEGKGTDID